MNYLRCEIISIHKNYLIVETNNVGYKIYLSPKSSLKEGQKALIYTFREFRLESKNQINSQLYGFLSYREFELFNNLISIKGIGCKTAQSILTNNLEEINFYLSKEDRLGLSKLIGFNCTLADSVISAIKRSKALRNAFISTSVSVNDSEQSNKAFKKDVWNENEIINSLTEIGYGWEEIKKALEKVKEEKVNYSDVDSVIGRCLQAISQAPKN